MNCILCGKTTNIIYKTVDLVPIYECKVCEFGFIDQKKVIQKNSIKLYSFSKYKKQEHLILDRVSRLTDKIVRFKKSGTVLEIGAGFGLFAQALLKKGKFTYHIIEPLLKPYYLKSYNFTHYKYDLDTFIKKNTKTFDLIILLDVIEHLHNPIQTILILKKILKENGVLVIQTPNYKSLMQELTENWSWWMVKDHKWFFSSNSMLKIIEKTGMDLMYEDSYEDWQDMKKNLDGNFYRFKNRIARKFVKSIFYITFMPFYFCIRPLLWKLGFGGLLFYILKKANNSDKLLKIE